MLWAMLHIAATDTLSSSSSGNPRPPKPVRPRKYHASPHKAPRTLLFSNCLETIAEEIERPCSVLDGEVPTQEAHLREEGIGGSKIAPSASQAKLDLDKEQAKLDTQWTTPKTATVQPTWFTIATAGIWRHSESSSWDAEVSRLVEEEAPRRRKWRRQTVSSTLGVSLNVPEKTKAEAKAKDGSQIPVALVVESA